MTFSTTNLSSTVVFGKCSLSQIAVDRHLAVNSKVSGIPAVKLGPALARGRPQKASCWALRGVFNASYFGAGGCRAPTRATNLNIFMQARRSLPAKLRLRFSSYSFLIGAKTTTGRPRLDAAKLSIWEHRASEQKVEKGERSTAEHTVAQPCDRPRHHVRSRVVAVRRSVLRSRHLWLKRLAESKRPCSYEMAAGAYDFRQRLFALRLAKHKQ